MRFDPTPWLGKVRPGLHAQLKSYRELCERRISHAVGTLTPDFQKNGELTKRVCDCTTAHLRNAKDPNYVQVVNMELRGTRASLPKMPPELSLYVVNYNDAELNCVNNITRQNQKSAQKLRKTTSPRQPTSTKRKTR